MSVYNDDNFAGRVNYAASVIGKGTMRSTTRHFDTCFEMHDGDAVGAAIWRRALKNPKLMANLPRYLNADMCRGNYETYQGQDLPKVAAKLRAEAKAKFEAFMEEQRAKKQA